MSSLHLPLLLLVACLLLAPSHAWWGGPRTTRYCGVQIDDKVVQHCHPIWLIGSCIGGCPGRRKRDMDVALSDEAAKAFIQATHIRRKRSAVAGLQEECCREKCSEEEIVEHC